MTEETEVMHIFIFIGLITCLIFIGYIIVSICCWLLSFCKDVGDWKRNKEKTFEKLREAEKQRQEYALMCGEVQDLRWKFALADGRAENLNVEVDRYTEALIKERDTVKELKKELKACQLELKIYKQKEAEELARNQERGMLR